MVNLKILSQMKTMSIKGIGTDIIEISRIKEVLERKKDAFLKKVFTKNEIEYSKKFKDPTPHLAARFAAKEAVSKALGIGLGKISFLDIEVLNDEKGKPNLKLSKKLIEEFSSPKIEISLSHCNEYAVAFAIYF